MAQPTLIQGQDTDAVSQIALATTGEAGPLAIGLQQQVWSSAMGLGFQNAVARQQGGQTLGDALLAASLEMLGAGNTKGKQNG